MELSSHFEGEYPEIAQRHVPRRPQDEFCTTRAKARVPQKTILPKGGVAPPVGCPLRCRKLGIEPRAPVIACGRCITSQGRLRAHPDKPPLTNRAPVGCRQRHRCWIATGGAFAPSPDTHEQGFSCPLHSLPALSGLDAVSHIGSVKPRQVT